MMLRIVMYSRGRGKIFCLPDVEKDTITAAAPSYEKYQVTFVAMDHQWYAVRPEEMTWSDGEDTRERCLHHEMSLILKSEDAMIGIYCSEILQEDVRFGKYVLTGETLQIGRHEDCGVCSPDKRLSDHHGVLKVSGDSLRGEVKRRERLFKKYDVDNIDAYIRYVNPLADSRKLSHILIVIDEFSELMDELPDFMSELISTARVGRSVGLHLLLATQRPSNKVGPEIWSNSRFHICLQVRTREDSNDMLHRPDAAFIKGNGRVFVQVGNDELFEQIQTAYCGAAYEPDQGNPAAKPALMDSLGRRKKIVAASNASTKKAKSQMNAVLDKINRTAEVYGYQKPGNLWLPELPNVIDLTALPSAEENTEDGISAVIGMLDDVANQRYLTVSLNVSVLRNMAIIGHSQSGKTMFLQTIAYAISRRYSPEQVQMMELSFSGTALKSIEKIPNVCDVLTKWESREERAAYYRLEELMTARDATFAEKKTDSFASYNRACAEDGEPVMPALIVAADRFVQWYELLNDNEQEKVENLIKTASGRGVYFIVTANAMGEINRRLLEAMQVIPLGMGSASEYADALNVRTSSIQAIPADLPGRGVMNSEQGCLEFQTGLAFGLAEDRKRAEKLHEYGESLSQCSAPVLKMPRVPAEFSAQVLAAYAVKEKNAEVPIAFRHDSLKPVCLDFYEKPTVLVAGKRETGKTSLLMSLAKLCAGDDGDIFVIASEAEHARWKTINGHVTLVLCACSTEMAETAAGVEDYSLASKLEAMYAKYERGKTYESAGNMVQARKSFSNVVANYAENVYGSYKDAAEYYHYAQGWLCFWDEQYTDAAEHFQRCSSSKFSDVVYYIMYVQGSEELASGDLTNAEKDLKEAREYTILSGMAAEQLDVLWKLQKELDKAAAALQSVILHFTAKKQGGDGAAIEIAWRNQQSINDYLITVSTCVEAPDVSGDAVEVAKDESVAWTPDENGCAFYSVQTTDADVSFSVSGLWQGSTYYIRVYDARQLAQCECNSISVDRTDTNETYIGAEEDVNVRMFRVRKTSYSKTISEIDRGSSKGSSPAVTLFNAGSAQRVNDFAIEISEENLAEYGYYLEIVKAVGKINREAFDGKETAIYLHVEGGGTARMVGQWPMDQVGFLPGTNADTMMTIYLADLFDQLQGIPVGADWCVELLLDDEIIFSASGVTK